MRLNVIILILIALAYPSLSKAQSIENFGKGFRGEKGIRMVFYNVENLFDTEDDSLKNDEEFLPTGVKNWTKSRYEDKLQRIGKTITSIGGWEAPELVGLCEIENRGVLDDLIHHPILKNNKYAIVHQESPDNRGIDVALLYQPKKFDVISYEAIPIHFPFEDSRPTRDILYVKGKVLDTDTLHIFVNHWPSRYGGMLASEPKRVFVASVLRKKIDAILQESPNANIVITGDFNDEPENKSLTETLKAHLHEEELKDNELYNLMFEKAGKEGTHKFDGRWGLLDQFLVSTALLKGKNKLSVTAARAQIFKGSWLLTEETRTEGLKPFRTYVGFKYMDGYSDHLPIYLDLSLKNK